MKRFWKDATVRAAPGGWQVALDGRGVTTAEGKPQIVPRRALARLLAAEWAAQGETIDPARFAHRGMADFAVDRVPREDMAARLVAFAKTDTLCYRADPGDALLPRQEAMWEPILTALETAEGVRFTRIGGVIPRPQPDRTLARLGALVAALDPFTQAALLQISALAASLAIGLAALRAGADPVALWNAANLEEDWQAGLWGADAEAAALRAARAERFAAAIAFAHAARGA